MKIRTSHFESLFVLAVVLLPFLFVEKIQAPACVTAAAVFFTFQHAVLADRLQEREALKRHPAVAGYWKTNLYFLSKEALWICFFLMSQAWGALLGSIVFFFYPFWRRWYRARFPIETPHP